MLLKDLETFVSKAGNLALGVLHDGDQPMAADSKKVEVFRSSLAIGR